FVDRLSRVRGSIKADIVRNPFGKGLLQVVHLGQQALMKVERVGVGHLEDGQEDRIAAVETGARILVLGAYLDMGHIVEASDAAIAPSFQDDVLELLDLGQSAEC